MSAGGQFGTKLVRGCFTEISVAGGRAVVSRTSNSTATSTWLRRNIRDYEFQAAIASGHFPIATNKVFQMLLARLEQAENDQKRS